MVRSAYPQFLDYRKRIKGFRDPSEADQLYEEIFIPTEIADLMRIQSHLKVMDSKCMFRSLILVDNLAQLYQQLFLPGFNESYIHSLEREIQVTRAQLKSEFHLCYTWLKKSLDGSGPPSPLQKALITAFQEKLRILNTKYQATNAGYKDMARKRQEQRTEGATLLPFLESDVLQQVQIHSTTDLKRTVEILAKKDQDLREIEMKLLEIDTMMRDYAGMVESQGETLLRIDSLMEKTAIDISKAQKEILKTEALIQTNNPSRLSHILGSILVFLMVFAVLKFI